MGVEFVSMDMAKKKGFGKELLLLVVLTGIIAIVVKLTREEGSVGDRESDCKVNLLNMATGMEMYSTDHHGRYPDSYEKLLPSYLQALPVCPEGGNYVLQVGPQAPGNEQGYQDYYLFICTSDRHPQPLGYNAIQGPIDPTGLKSLPAPTGP